MANLKERGVDAISNASSQARKRKRLPTPDSDFSDGDRRPTKTTADDSESSQRSRGVKRSQGLSINSSSKPTKPSAPSKSKGKGRAFLIDDTSDESEEEIVVASTKSSSASAIKRPSVSKPIEAESPHVDRKKQNKHVKVVQFSDDEEDERPTTSSRLSKASSSKPHVSLSSRNHTNGDPIRNMASDHVKSKGNSTSAKSPKSHRTKSLDDYRFTSNKSPSPLKASQGSFTVSDAQDSVKNKRLQSHINSLKQRYDESEDRFNEASAQCENLKARLMEIEHKLKRSEKARDDSIGKMKESAEGNGDVQRLAQAQIEAYEHKLTIKDNEYHEAMIVLQRDLERARRELRDARGESIPEQPAWAQRQQTADARRASQLRQKLGEQQEEYEAKIERLENELSLKQNTTQLAAKEREVDAIRLACAQELERKEESYKRLKALYDMDKQAWSSRYDLPTQHSNLAPSEDIIQLQKLVSTLTKQKANYELHFQATMDTYEARIKRMQREVADSGAKDREHLALLESSRASLDFDRARFQGQVASLQRELKKLREEVPSLRETRPRYENLKRGHSELVRAYNELKKDHEVTLRTMYSLSEERASYAEKIRLLESKADEYIALLQASQPGNGNEGDPQERYRLLKSTYTMERQKYKRKIEKLERRLAKLGGGSDITSDLQTSIIQSTSEEEGSASHAGLRKTARQRSEHYRQNGLESQVFDETDTASSAFARRVPHQRSLSSHSPGPAKLEANLKLIEKIAAIKDDHAVQLQLYESAKPVYHFPPTLRERKADTKVPRHKSRVYVRSECHTPYVPDEMVSDSDDEFIEWESQAYAKSQASNPDRRAALVNTCWNRHILDFRCNRVRSTNLHFCIEFVESYGPLIHSRDATAALLKHILKLVDLGQLAVDEGGTIIRAYHQAV